MVLRQSLRASILIPRQQAERAKEHWGVRLKSGNLPQWQTSSNKATPSDPSQAVLPTRDQISKYVSLWGSFTFKSPHPGFSLLHLPYEDTGGRCHLLNKKWDLIKHWQCGRLDHISQSCNYERCLHSILRWPQPNESTLRPRNDKIYSFLCIHLFHSNEHFIHVAIGYLEYVLSCLGSGESG